MGAPPWGWLDKDRPSGGRLSFIASRNGEDNGRTGVQDDGAGSVVHVADRVKEAIAFRVGTRPARRRDHGERTKDGGGGDSGGISERQGQKSWRRQDGVPGS